MNKELARDIAYGALRIDWWDTESAARRVAEYAADMIEAYRKEHEEVLAGALAAERERCAKVAETEGVAPWTNTNQPENSWYKHGQRIAAAIRAQGQTE